jgi:hypothetical protein
LRCHDTPPIEQAMDYRGRDQRRGKSVERRAANVVIVIVRAGRADGEDVMVDAQQQQVSRGKQNEAARPADLRNQFRQQAEDRNAQQQAARERDHHARAVAGAAQTHADSGAKKGCRRSQKRDTHTAG